MNNKPRTFYTALIGLGVVISSQCRCRLSNAFVLPATQKKQSATGLFSVTEKTAEIGGTKTFSSNNAPSEQDAWVAQSFDATQPAVVGPERCLVYDTTLRGKSVFLSRGILFCSCPLHLQSSTTPSSFDLWFAQMGPKWNLSTYPATTS